MIQKNKDRPPGLKFSSEVENFKRATHQTLLFGGELRRPRFNISSEIEFSIEIENFKRDLFSQSLGP